MSKQHTEVSGREQDMGFWGTVGSALATIARRTGSSASECPLPEVRAAMRDVTQPRPKKPRRLAA